MTDPYALNVIAQFPSILWFFQGSSQDEKVVSIPLSQEMKDNLRKFEATENCTAHGSETKK